MQKRTSLSAISGLAILVLFAGIAFASTDSTSLDATGNVIFTQNRAQIDSYFETGEMKAQILSSINAQAATAPKEIFSLFGNRKINVYVTMDEGSVESYWVKVAAHSIGQVSLGARSDAGFEVDVSEKTVDGIVNSSKPFDRILNAINSGEIKYRALTEEGKGSELLVNVGAKIAGVFLVFINFFTGIFR